jgi:hypothetical protein
MFPEVESWQLGELEQFQVDNLVFDVGFNSCVAATVSSLVSSG